jgi:hypothetical protein
MAKRVHASQTRAYVGGKYPSSNWGGATSKPKPGATASALGGARHPKRGRVPKK